MASLPMHYQNGGDYVDKWSELLRGRNQKIITWKEMWPAGQVIINEGAKLSPHFHFFRGPRNSKCNDVGLSEFCAYVSILSTKFTHRSSKRRDNEKLSD